MRPECLPLHLRLIEEQDCGIPVERGIQFSKSAANHLSGIISQKQTKGQISSPVVQKR